MINAFENSLHQDNFSESDLINLLSAENEEQDMLFHNAADIKKNYVGNKVYLRGLIEISNYCKKDCFYCGIRNGNTTTQRYNLSDDSILEACRFAHEKQLGSVVLQGGELSSKQYTKRIETLIKKIKVLSNWKLGITLSLGEQSQETYQRWFEAGAHRYLLRIETSDPNLYKKIHPEDNLHQFDKRLKCLKYLRESGYQVGTGVMIGLPFQGIESLAKDLLFFKKLDIDMVGMGPYIEHKNTPLYQHKDLLIPLERRYWLALKMVATLRLLMKDINIAATTALQAIYANGRNKAIQVGANIMMPNITPGIYRNVYKLYENKPLLGQNDEDNINTLINSIESTGNTIILNQWGDSLHFRK